MKNARNYYLHKITKEITDNNDIIVTEKLQTKNMLQNKKLSKSITDASFHEIIRQLQYKSKNKRKYFYQIDTFYPSSQTCSVCGNIDSEYKDFYVFYPTLSDVPKNITAYKAGPNYNFYYEGNFSDNMPEFNCDSLAVREEFKNIMKFYVEFLMLFIIQAILLLKTKSTQTQHSKNTI